MGLITDFGSMAIQAGQNRRQRKWASREAEKAYQREVEMWNMSNEYNSPKNQMQRYQDAGLNPNLIYGQGSPGNTAVSMPKYQPAEGKYGVGRMDFEPATIISKYQDFMLKKEVINNTRKNGQILDEERDQKILDNILKVFNIAYDAGYSGDNIPEKYKNMIGWDSTVTPGKEYDLDYKATRNRILNQKWLTEIQNTGLKGSLASWALRKLKQMEENNLNIDKDDFIDRMLMDQLGKEGGSYVSFLKRILPILSMFRK